MRTTESFDLSGVLAKDVDVLTQNAPRQRLEIQTDERRDRAETKRDHCIDICLDIVHRRALRRDDEVAIRAERIIDAARRRHHESVGVDELSAFWEKQSRDDTLPLRLFIEFRN